MKYWIFCVLFAAEASGTATYAIPDSQGTLTVAKMTSKAFSAFDATAQLDGSAEASFNAISDDAAALNDGVYLRNVVELVADNASDGTEETTDKLQLVIVGMHYEGTTPGGAVNIHDASAMASSAMTMAVNSNVSGVTLTSTEDIKAVQYLNGSDTGEKTVTIMLASADASKYYAKCGMTMGTAFAKTGAAADALLEIEKTAEVAKYSELKCECTMDKLQSAGTSPADVTVGALAAGEYYAATGTDWTVQTGHLVLIMATVSDDTITAYAEENSDGDDLTVAGSSLACPTIDGHVVDGAKADKVLTLIDDITADMKICQWDLGATDTTVSLNGADHLALNFADDVEAAAGTTLFFNMFGGAPAKLTAYPTMTTGGPCYKGLLHNWFRIDATEPDDSGSDISATTVTSFLVLMAGIFCQN